MFLRTKHLTAKFQQRRFMNINESIAQSRRGHYPSVKEKESITSFKHYFNRLNLFLWTQLISESISNELDTSLKSVLIICS